MATALRSLRVGEQSAGYTLPFSKIRSGLATGKHRKRMGEAIWLYLWLHGRAHLKTGMIPNYNHQDAADDLGASLRSVKAWLNTLATEGYIAVTRHRHSLDIGIVNYTPREVQDPALLNGRERQDSALVDLREVQNPAPRSAEVCTSPLLTETGLQRDQRSTTNVVASVAIPESLREFDAILRDSRGYQPGDKFFEKVAEKYGHLDLAEEALKMAGWLKTKRTRPASDAFILNWLKGAASDRAAGRGHGPSTNGAHAAGGRASGRGATLPASERDRIRAARLGLVDADVQ